MPAEDTLIQTIVTFLDHLGIPSKAGILEEDTFLPGIKIDRGTIIIDHERLKYPGDLLHEAGHVAIMTDDERESISGNVQEERPPGQNDELAAILWSYAALKHLDLKPEVVFHPDGYKGDSEWLINNLESGTYIGLPLLEWMGLTTADTFPKMLKWIRTSN